MRSYIERAQDFITEILPIIGNEMDPWTLESIMDKFNRDNHRRVLVRSGSARVAFITSDYVVKFDYDEEEVEEIGGCENEIYLWQLAQAEGFSHLFAEITRIEIKGRNFYIMPRIYGIGTGHGLGWGYMTESEKNWCQNHSLTDLHRSNYGFRKGHICIVDYAFQEDNVCEASSYYYYEHESEVSEN